MRQLYRDGLFLCYCEVGDDGTKGKLWEALREWRGGSGPRLLGSVGCLPPRKTYTEQPPTTLPDAITKRASKEGSLSDTTSPSKY